ncbi:MAG: hypothetical protein ACRC2T_13925 [Thermoguttaceae bacterium]
MQKKTIRVCGSDSFINYVVPAVLIGCVLLAGTAHNGHVTFAGAAENQTEEKQPDQNTLKPKKQVYGPRGIMDTSPIIEVEVKEPEPIDHETIDKIPLDERLKKYSCFSKGADQAGDFTPYYKGKLIGNLDSNSANEPNFIPFIWIPSDENAVRINMEDERSGNSKFTELELRKANSSWKSREIPLTPDKLYQFTVGAYSIKNNSVDDEEIDSDPFSDTAPKFGSLIAGTETARIQINGINGLPKQMSNYSIQHPEVVSCMFMAPKDTDECTVTLTSNSDCSLRIFHAGIAPVMPIYRGVKSAKPVDVKLIAGTSSFVGMPGDKPKDTANRGGDFVRLGIGEKIAPGEYELNATFGENGQVHRPLLHTSAIFNTDSVIFPANSEMQYRFDLEPIRIDEKPGNFILEPIRFLSGRVTVETLCTSAASPEQAAKWLGIEYSFDGNTWQTLESRMNDASGNAFGSDEFQIPQTQDVKEIFVRLKNTYANPITVKRINFKAKIDSEDYSGEGYTVFAKKNRGESYSTDEIPPPGVYTVPIMFSEDFTIYFLHVNESEEDQKFSAGSMDYSGKGTSLVHGDGPGKWTHINFRETLGAVQPHSAVISAWVYNWFGRGGDFSFSISHPGLSLSYEISIPKKEEGK